jgi:alcohol dehydrogenase (NADP+)
MEPSPSPDDVEAACDASLKSFGLSYVDLYLIHWPVAFKRGDVIEPKHPDGPIELENIDYIDVRPTFSQNMIKRWSD